MKRVLRTVMGSALGLCLVGSLALAGASAKTAPITTGDFIVNLVKAMDPKAPAGMTPDAAASELGKLGISVGGSMTSPLTEGQLVTLLRQFGVNVRAADPARTVSQAKANNVISTFRGEITKVAAVGGIVGAGGSGTNDDFNNGNGKGGKFKRKAYNSAGNKDE
jgi:hypothetical protein